MEKIRSSPFSFVFPWLSPLVVTFALAHGGIEVQLYRNNRLLKNWQPSIFHQFVPEPLIKWIDENRFHEGLQSYPLVRQFWHALLPLASQKLIIDASALAALEEISQPQDFALVWSLNSSLARIEGHYEGVEHYLGMGWFQKGTKIWSLANNILPPMYPPFENLVLPLQQAHSLLNMTIPYMQHYLPARADFQLISDFALQITALAVHSQGLTLGLQCNYPQCLPIAQIPGQRMDVLVGQRALIQFSHQTLTPVLAQLLQNGTSVTIRENDIPLVISEQLPLLRRYHQMSDEVAEKISQAYPIVSIAALKPTLAFSHRRDNGVGIYTLTTTCYYQRQALDMDALLMAYQQRQRFVQQHAVWFEWPSDAFGLAQTIQQQQIPQVLRADEVMGFDTRRTALVPERLPASAIQPGGKTPAERAQSLFKQLQYHGIPGGIVGEPKGLVTMFLAACENLLRDNRQARILWLAPSTKKGSVTRAVHSSVASSYVTVASLITLRDEPALLSRPWTLIIFQEWDVLLDGTPQTWGLFQLQSHWVLLSVTSKQAVNSAMMRVLHIPEQYYEQFCAHYLFDLESSSPQTAISRPAPSPALPDRAKVTPFSLPDSAKPAPAIQTPQPMPEMKKQVAVQPGATPAIRPAPERTNTKPTPRRHAIKLDQQKIARLHEENEYLQERLSVEDEEAPEQLFISPPPAPVEPVVSRMAESAPDMDEDWQTILQQWQPEHWEIIRLLCQGKSVQLTTTERKNHRPVSLLIDEINAPVEEQLGDLLIDAEALTIFSYQREFTENLVRWYDSSKGR